jgi:hypothetical protein
MSYWFDVMSKAWASLRDKLPPDDRHGEIAVRFEFLINEMHEANHRLKEAINHDAVVTRYAALLERAISGADAG